VLTRRRDSSWIRALYAHTGQGALTESEAVRCVYVCLIWTIEQNPVIEARVIELHQNWRIFKLWAIKLSKGAIKFLSVIPIPKTVPQPPLIIPMPCHWISETQDRRSYYCPTCFDFKGFLFDRTRCRPPPKNKRNKKPPALIHNSNGEFVRRGSERVAYCFKTRMEYCLHVKKNGRKSPKSKCLLPLVHVDIFGCAVQSKGHVFIPCRRCNMLHRRLPPSKDCGLCPKCGMLHRRHGASNECGLCAKRTASVCLLCNGKKELTPVLMFDDLGQGQDVRVFLCKEHRPSILAKYRRWNRHHLMKVITDEHMIDANHKYASRPLRS
jgi:hypothetical protein